MHNSFEPTMIFFSPSSSSFHFVLDVKESVMYEDVFSYVFLCSRVCVCCSHQVRRTASKTRMNLVRIKSYITNVDGCYFFWSIRR